MLNEGKIFICLTPLQMKISERIISENNIVDYKLICLFLIKNEKYIYYYERLKENSNASFVYYPKEKVTGFYLLKDVYVFKRMILKSGILKGVSSVYAASIDNRYVQLIVSILKNANIYTFDDGLANLNYNGSYHRNESLPKFRLLLWKMVGVSVFTQDFRKRSSLHYTLYSGKKNIIDKIDNISLFSSLKKKNNNEESVCNIFLGQPLCEVNSEVDDKYINKVLKDLMVDFYFPHPRESYNIGGDIVVIKSNFIFEDYVLDLFERNDKLTKINVYTFFSTAVLNLNSFYFVDAFIVFDAKFRKEVYDVFKGFDVEYIYLDGV